MQCILQITQINKLCAVIILSLAIYMVSSCVQHRSSQRRYITRLRICGLVGLRELTKNGNTKYRKGPQWTAKDPQKDRKGLSGHCKGLQGYFNLSSPMDWLDVSATGVICDVHVINACCTMIVIVAVPSLMSMTVIGTAANEIMWSFLIVVQRWRKLSLWTTSAS